MYRKTLKKEHMGAGAMIALMLGFLSLITLE